MKSLANKNFNPKTALEDSEEYALILSIALDQTGANTETGLVKAGEFLAFKAAGATIEQIGQEWGVSRQQVYIIRDALETSGDMEKARKVFLYPKLRQINEKIDEVFQSWPEILDKIVDVAKQGRFDSDRIAAANWLLRNIIQPRIENQPPSSSPENAYLNADRKFDPTNVEKPNWLLREGKATPK